MQFPDIVKRCLLTCRYFTSHIISQSHDNELLSSCIVLSDFALSKRPSGICWILFPFRFLQFRWEVGRWTWRHFKWINSHFHLWMLIKSSGVEASRDTIANSGGKNSKIQNQGNLQFYDFENFKATSNFKQIVMQILFRIICRLHGLGTVWLDFLVASAFERGRKWKSLDIKNEKWTRV